MTTNESNFVLVNLKYPVNSTFLSLSIYEGLLFLASELAYNISPKQIIFDKDFLNFAYKKLADTLNNNRLEKINIRFVRNDEYFKRKLKAALNIQDQRNRSENYGDLIKKVIETIVNNSTRTKEIFLRNSINFDVTILRISGDYVEAIDYNNNILTAPQLLKVNRYVNFVSIDSSRQNLISEEITLRISLEISLIFLLGIYSSFILSKITKNKKTVYYFLFFSPEEIKNILNSGNKDQLRVYINIKNKLRDIIEKIINENDEDIKESLFLEIMTNLELMKTLKLENIDKISFIMLKIVLEGSTYKIYEEIPINIYKDTRFNLIIYKYFKNREELLKVLSEIIQSIVSMKKTDKLESIMYKVILSLYRFVVLGDMQGYLEFLRYMNLAIKVLENENRSDEAQKYIKLLSKFNI